MRYGLLVLGAAFCVGLYQGWFVQAYDLVTNAALTEEARVAIDVRCRSQEGRSARACRSILKKLYLAGTLDPDRTLRTYCNSVKTARWAGDRPAPPEVCVQRYGGWPKG